MGKSPKRSKFDWARRLFYLHALAALCVIVGFNILARLPTLGWGRPELMWVLAIIIGVSLLLSTVLPLVILTVAICEKHSWFRVTAITGLSVVLMIASFYALLPSVM